MISRQTVKAAALSSSCSTRAGGRPPAGSASASLINTPPAPPSPPPRPRDSSGNTALSASSALASSPSDLTVDVDALRREGEPWRRPPSRREQLPRRRLRARSARCRAAAATASLQALASGRRSCSAPPPPAFCGAACSKASSVEATMRGRPPGPSPARGPRNGSAPPPPPPRAAAPGVRGKLLRIGGRSVGAQQFDEQLKCVGARVEAAAARDAVGGGLVTGPSSSSDCNVAHVTQRLQFFDRERRRRQQRRRAAAAAATSHGGRRPPRPSTRVPPPPRSAWKKAGHR